MTKTTLSNTARSAQTSPGAHLRSSSVRSVTRLKYFRVRSFRCPCHLSGATSAVRMAASTRLPKILSDLVPVIGLEGVIKLAVAKGGRRVYIPKEAANAPWLIEVLGQEAAEALCKHLRSYSFNANERLRPSGSTFKLPLARQFRHRLMFEQARREGLSIEQTAARCGVEERTVSYWRKKWPLRPPLAEPAE